LLAEWDEMKKLYRGPYIDAFCQVWFHLAQLFKRSRLKYEKVKGRTTDAMWWQYLWVRWAKKDNKRRPLLWCILLTMRWGHCCDVFFSLWDHSFSPLDLWIWFPLNARYIDRLVFNANLSSISATFLYIVESLQGTKMLYTWYNFMLKYFIDYSMCR
jgi:hypothetical protein